jgi:ATP-dependent helicase/nuclease subunit B
MLRWRELKKEPNCGKKHWFIRSFRDGCMSVRFILGRSGTGKTAWCVGRIVQALLDETDNQPLMFLVPEQATYQAERAILADNRIAGYDRLNVLSFERLGYLLLGKSTAKSSLSQIGRQMIVQRLLRVHADSLKIFGAAAGRVGAGRAIAQTITELHQYGRTAEDIDELIETLAKYDADSLTALKFADIGLIFKEYLRFIEGKFIDPDVQLNLSRRAVGESTIVKGAKLWVDGFAGFTAAELSILAEVLRSVSDASIALCVDPKSLDTSGDAAMLDPTSLFGPTERTYCELLEIIKKCKLKIDGPVVLDEAKRFSSCRALAHLEQQFSQFEPKQAKADGSIMLAAAPNSRSEVRFVARQILQLVRQRNYRYRDIAVIASDIDYYEHYLRAYLEDYGIPYFIDKRKPLRRHPVIGLVLSALSVATQGFSQTEISNYLKTGLTTLSSYEIDLLENYCIAFGIDNRDWQDESPWDFAGDDDKKFGNAQIEALRMKVAKPLKGLRIELCGNEGQKQITAEQFTRAIFDFLERLGVRERLNEWVGQALNENDSEQANYHQQFCERFADTFDEMTEAFTGLGMNCSQWTEVLEAAVGQMSLAFIPPRLDQVLVGSIERSRHPDLKAAFLIGCTQKQFPSPVSYDCVLTDSDRLAAGDADFALGPSLRDELAQRQYLAYIAFTRPAEYLCVSYPLVDEKGSAAVCSRYVGHLESLFSDLRVERIDSQQIDISSVGTGSELAQVICIGAGADAVDNGRARKLRLLVGEMWNDDELSDVAQSVAYALDYDNKAELGRSVAETIFEKTIRCSATRFGAFASCPYQHFARYVLGLEERKEFRFEPLDKGLFYHKVLDSLVKELNERKIDLAEMEEQELLKILRSRVDVLLQEDSFTRNFFRRSKHNAYIIHSAIESLEAFVLATAQMMRAGDFRVKLSEVRFGDADSSLGVCKLTCDNSREVLLNGLLDRLDTVKIDSQEVGLVFDYKLSGRSFSFSKFCYGIDMQLGIYMLAVKTSGIKPVGAFYVPIEAGAKRTDFGEVQSRSGKFEYKANGIFHGEYAAHIDRTVRSGWSRFYNYGVSKKDDQYGYYSASGVLFPQDFERFIEFTEQKICELTAQMAEGRIEVSPYRLNTETPCGWCKYRSVCRFDWQINDYRVLPVLRKADVLGQEDRGNG